MKFSRISILIAGFVLAVSGCQSGDQPGTTETNAVVPAGVTLLSVVEKTDTDNIVIPHKKYELDNGLTLVLHADDSDPLVHIDLTFHVGSAREEVGNQLTS